MEQLEKEYVTEARQKWKEITEMMAFEPEEVKLATFQGLLRPFIYWSEDRAGTKNSSAGTAPWYKQYPELRPSTDSRLLSIVSEWIPDLRFKEIIRDAKKHGYEYDSGGHGFIKEGATA